MEKKIRIDVEIAGAVENLEKVNASLEETESTAKSVNKAISGGSDAVKAQGAAIVEQNKKVLTILEQEMQTLEELKRKRASAYTKKELQEYERQIEESGAKIKMMGGNFTSLKNIAMMSLGEMRKEMMRLRNMSFEGLSEQEIAGIRARMSELTEGMRDFREQLGAASESGIPGVVFGLQGLIAAAQGVTAGLSMFGIESERMQQIMIQLMGVTQALATVEDAYARGKFKQMKVTIAATAAQVKAKIATTALGKAMLSLPIGWIIAGLAAITTAVILIVRAFRDKTTALENLTKKYKETFDEGVKLVAQMEMHAVAVRSAEKGTKDHANAVNKYNEMAKEQKLLLLDINSSMGEQNRIMKENQKLILARATMTAAEEELIELLKQRFQLQQAHAKADGMHWDWKLNQFVNEKDMIAAQINSTDEQIRSVMTLNTQLGNWVGAMDDVIAKQAEQRIVSDTLAAAEEELGRLTRLRAQYTKELATATGLSRITIQKEIASIDEQIKKLTTLEWRRASGLKIPLMISIKPDRSAVEAVEKALADIQKELTLKPIKAETTYTDYFKKDKKMSRETALFILHDINSTLEAQEAAVERIIELDNLEFQNKIDKIQRYQDMSVSVAGTVVALADAIASGAEEGSERERRARKAAAIAALAISSAETAGNIAQGISKAQLLPPPLNIQETIRQAALGVTLLARILQAKNEISKLAEGGRGEFRGASHAGGGIQWNGHEVEGGEKWYVLSKQHSRRYGHIMDKVFDEIKGGKAPNTGGNIFAPNINLNDEYTKGMYGLMKQPQQQHSDRYREVKQGNRITRIYK